MDNYNYLDNDQWENTFLHPTFPIQNTSARRMNRGDTLDSTISGHV